MFQKYIYIEICIYYQLENKKLFFVDERATASNQICLNLIFMVSLFDGCFHYRYTSNTPENKLFLFLSTKDNQRYVSGKHKDNEKHVNPGMNGLTI